MLDSQLRRTALALLVPFALAEPLAFADEGPTPAPLPAPPYVAGPAPTPAIAPSAPLPPAAPQLWAVPAVMCGSECEKAVPVVMSYRTTPRYGLLITGAAVFGALYMIGAVPMTLATGDLKLAIPVAGPLILANQLKGSDPVVLKFWLAMDGLGQAAMLAMFIAGAASRRQTPVYEKMMVLPAVNPGGAGLTAIGRF